MTSGISFPRGNFHQGSWYFFISPFPKEIIYIWNLENESSSYRLYLSCCHHQPWWQPICPRISSHCAFLAPMNIADNGWGNSIILFVWVENCEEKAVLIMSICLLYMPLWRRSCAYMSIYLLYMSFLAEWSFQDTWKPNSHPTPTLHDCGLSTVINFPKGLQPCTVPAIIMPEQEFTSHSVQWIPTPTCMSNPFLPIHSHWHCLIGFS